MRLSCFPEFVDWPCFSEDGFRCENTNITWTLFAGGSQCRGPILTTLVEGGTVTLGCSAGTAGFPLDPQKVKVVFLREEQTSSTEGSSPLDPQKVKQPSEVAAWLGFAEPSCNHRWLQSPGAGGWCDWQEIHAASPSL